MKFQNENIGIRSTYCLFSFCLLNLWFQNARYLIVEKIKSLKNIIDKIEDNPSTVFTYGRSLFSSVNSVSLAAIIILTPCFSWIPTLLTAGISPKTIAFILGIIISTIILILPFFSQAQINKALNKTFDNIDKNITKEIVKEKITQDSLSQLKDLVKLREDLSRSISISTQEFMISIVQFTTIITAFIRTFTI